MSDDIRDLEENEELEEQDEVEGHISKLDMSSEADDDDFEAHIRLD